MSAGVTGRSYCGFRGSSQPFSRSAARISACSPRRRQCPDSTLTAAHTHTLSVYTRASVVSKLMHPSGQVKADLCAPDDGAIAAAEAPKAKRACLDEEPTCPICFEIIPRRALVVACPECFFGVTCIGECTDTLQCPPGTATRNSDGNLRLCCLCRTPFNMSDNMHRSGMLLSMLSPICPHVKYPSPSFQSSTQALLGSLKCNLPRVFVSVPAIKLPFAKARSLLW
eukprot:COSAG02_NODE_16_length_56207_cov_9.816122_4_plen_226_part_00